MKTNKNQKFGRSYKCTSSAGFSSEKFFLLEEIHCKISSLLNIYFVCGFSFEHFFRKTFIVGVRRCEKSTSSAGFQVKNVFRKQFIVGVLRCEKSTFFM